MKQFLIEIYLHRDWIVIISFLYRSED